MIIRPWDNEPEEVPNWQAHGLECAMKRNHGRAWCGYVAVPEGHALHGKHYDDKVYVDSGVMNRPIDVDKVGVLNIFCSATAETKDGLANGLMPLSVSLDCHGGLTWAADHQPGHEPDGRWWLGFDCSHAGDITPEISKLMGYDLDPYSRYRDIEYVRGVTEELARQIAEWSGPLTPDDVGRRKHHGWTKEQIMEDIRSLADKITKTPLEQDEKNKNIEQRLRLRLQVTLRRRGILGL